MKVLTCTLLFILFFSISCNSQESYKEVSINYTAQTRGYKYVLQLKNNTLELNNNQVLEKITLSEEQQEEVRELLSKIDFKKIKNNISTENLATDKAIKGVFELHFNNKQYSYEFDHNKLPTKIETIKIKLESFFN